MVESVAAAGEKRAGLQVRRETGRGETLRNEAYWVLVPWYRVATRLSARYPDQRGDGGGGGVRESRESGSVKVAEV